MPSAPANPTGAPSAGRPLLYPVSLVVAGRPCLVVGGGPVAARKAAGLVECDADVTVIAPDVIPAIEELAGRGALSILRRPYRSGEAAAYRLVVTATGVPDVDQAVAADADAAGVWVNAADNRERCTFTLPAVHREGPVAVAVSTSGASPALASWLRRRTAEALVPEVGALAGLMEAARTALREKGIDTSGIDWHALLDGPLPGLVAAGRRDEARRLIDRAAAGEATLDAPPGQETR
jgi:precorrin-2 dehydrogenase / sirohydrochlorin ferrochelatase